jgi:hypothetical protein
VAAIGSTSDLKRRFDGRAILEVLAARPMDAMRLLDTMPEVEKTSIFGTAVHAVIRKGQPDVAAVVRQRLLADGVAVSSIETVRPSLEDVFLEVAEAA